MGRTGQGGHLAPLALALGSLATWLPSAPLPPLVLAISTGLGLVLVASGRARLLGCCLLAACWSQYHLLFRLDERLPASAARQVVSISGQVVSIPRVDQRRTSFEFLVEPAAAGTDLPRRWLLRWYRDPPPLATGERWALEVVASPPWGRVNFRGEDRERWLLSQGIGALGSVRDGRRLAPAGDFRAAALRWRQSVFDAIGEAVPDPLRGGVVQALGTADRSRLGREHLDWLRLTGTSHLLAISGLHVGLAAAGGMLLFRAVFALLPMRVGGYWPVLLPTAAGLSAAAAYAALAGFGMPTLRALLMLSVAMAALLLTRVIAPFRALTLALACALLLNPLAPLTAGFWLSFAAVTALLLLAVPRPGRWTRVRALVGAQFAVTLFLLPACAAWFGGFSLVALLANLVAIPWVSLCVVPLVLLGIGAHALSTDAVAALAWQGAGAGAGLLFEWLEVAAGWQLALAGGLVPLRGASLVACAVAALGAALLLLPRGLPLRWSGSFLLLPLLAPQAPNATGASVANLEFLDVGQGTAVMLGQGERLLLYDTGPGDGAEANLVDPVIAPALRSASGAPPDIVFTSHGDLDHAGGLGALLARYPSARFFASLRNRPAGVLPCEAGDRHAWGDWRIEVLHPGFALPYLGNDSSCVLSLRGPNASVLLAGDIGSTVEARLLAAGLATHDVLLVPHHGSLTSSSEDFIGAVAPGMAIATAAPGNRFGFPRPEVRERYRRAGAAFWSTAGCGAIRLRWSADGTLRATSARRARPAPWRWPAEPGCPLDRDLH